MLGEGGTALEKLHRAVVEFQARDTHVDLKGLRLEIDALEREFASEACAARQSGEHLVAGNVSAVSWIARSCGMSATSAADRLCVGEQLESLPRVAAALSSGEISYQSASLLCHLREQLGDKRDLFDEVEMLELARRHSVATLRYLCRYARHVADPDGFAAEAEESFTRRRLHISQMADGMHLIDGVLDPVGGAALKTAIDALAKRLGADDERTPAQRRADSLVELAQHAMDEGRLPRRNGVKPHLTVTTTLEGLKSEAGAPPAEVEQTLPVSTRTLQRIACDSTISRVLLADSVVTDVGRATRVVSGPTRRALQARDRGCRWPEDAAGLVATGTWAGRARITSSSGLAVVRPGSATSCFSATFTTDSCMRVDGRC
jgi:hypothetical protein